MIRAVGIDDEPHCLDRLRHLLAGHCPATVQLIGTAQSVEEGVHLINALRPDLVFLDVQIHEQTGFDLLKQMYPFKGDVIFTTAFEKYAVQAFRFSAVDYLLKPIDPDDLKQAVAKLAPRTPLPDIAHKLDTLLHNIRQNQPVLKRICVPVLNGFVFLQVSDIVRCQSEGNYTTLFMKDKQTHVVSRTLKEFDELLSDADFFRVHHSHLINLTYLKSYNRGKGGFVLMTDGSAIDVSTRRKDDFLRRIVSL